MIELGTDGPINGQSDSNPDSKAGANLDRSRATVYVVENNVSVRESLVRMLSERGYRLESFTSAEHFLAAGAANRPGCVLLDYSLPGIGSRDLQDRLLTQLDSAPIVVTIGQADVPAALRFMERCAVSLLEKPFQPEQLVAALDKSIEFDITQTKLHSRYDEIGSAVEQLSSREKTVLQAIVAGQLNKAIARALDVSVRTIEGDRAKIVEKFSAETTGEVVGKFAQYSLLTELGFKGGRRRGVR